MFLLRRSLPYIFERILNYICFVRSDSETADSITGATSVAGSDTGGSVGDAPGSVGDTASNQMSGVGGPLLSSVNGAIGPNRSEPRPPSSVAQTPASADLSNTITLNNSTTFTSVTINSNELNLLNEFDIFPSSTWELVSEDR